MWGTLSATFAVSESEEDFEVVSTIQNTRHDPPSVIATAPAATAMMSGTLSYKRALGAQFRGGPWPC